MQVTCCAASLRDEQLKPSREGSAVPHGRRDTCTAKWVRSAQCSLRRRSQLIWAVQRVVCLSASHQAGIQARFASHRFLTRRDANQPIRPDALKSSAGRHFILAQRRPAASRRLLATLGVTHLNCCSASARSVWFASESPTCTAAQLAHITGRARFANALLAFCRRFLANSSSSIFGSSMRHACCAAALRDEQLKPLPRRVRLLLVVARDTCTAKWVRWHGAVFGAGLRSYGQCSVPFCLVGLPSSRHPGILWQAALPDDAVT